jgi:ABC-2 type transport system permease protein
MSKASKRGALSRYAAMTRECLKVALSNALAYRANFIMSSLIVFFSNVLFPLVTILIYGSGASFPGWGFFEVLLIQGIFTVASGLSATFFGGVFWATNLGIREGTFEVNLLKPVSTLFFMVVTSVNVESLGMVLGGLLMGGIALAHVGPPSLTMLLASLAYFSGGLCVMLGISLVMAATSFKWVGNSRIPEIFDSVLSFAKYPRSIFPQAVRGVITFVVPVSMVGFFPAEALLGRAQPEYFWALIPCALFLTAGIALFNFMIRLYEGAGG